MYFIPPPLPLPTPAPAPIGKLNMTRNNRAHQWEAK
jgi:hypothetical protein